MSTREIDFETMVANTLEAIKELLLIKGKEYRRNNNPYHNFERGAEMHNKTREEILQGMLLKHLISVEDMRNDTRLGLHQTPEKINEKYNDILVYYLIEKAMLLENVKIYKNSLPKEKRVLSGLSNGDILKDCAKVNMAELNKTNIFTRDE